MKKILISILLALHILAMHAAKITIMNSTGKDSAIVFFVNNNIKIKKYVPAGKTVTFSLNGTVQKLQWTGETIYNKCPHGLEKLCLQGCPRGLEKWCGKHTNIFEASNLVIPGNSDTMFELKESGLWHDNKKLEGKGTLEVPSDRIAHKFINDAKAEK